MDIGSKETLCSHCIHNDVCAYKKGFLSILKTISEACVLPPNSNGNSSDYDYKKVTDFDFINDISINCRYYQNSNTVKYVTDYRKG